MSYILYNKELAQAYNGLAHWRRYIYDTWGRCSSSFKFQVTLSHTSLSYAITSQNRWKFRAFPLIHLHVTGFVGRSNERINGIILLFGRHIWYKILPWQRKSSDDLPKDYEALNTCRTVIA